VRTALVAAICLLALPAGAMAKGPQAASIAGPGLVAPLHLGGEGEWDAGGPLERLVTDGGFFEAVWGGESGSLLARSPTARLGPLYRVTYFVPGPSGRSDRIRQQLYPYARGGPLTYTPPGQPFFDTERTRGGWFRAAPRLLRPLIAAGLPRQARPPPAKATAAEESPRSLLGVAALVLVLLAAAAALVVRRTARLRARSA
jgi:hypothetical protein